MDKLALASYRAKVGVTVAISALGFYVNSSAHETERVGKLEQEIQQLKLRLQKLEPPSATINPKAAQPVSVEGWKSKLQWRRLRQGMLPEDVRELLGEPERVMGGDFTRWVYPGYAVATFYEGKLDSWQEPR